MPSTRRQTISATLEQRPATLKELARDLRTSARVIRDDLEHIRRGLPHGHRFVIEPAICGKCDFVFRSRDRLETPSRCPSCRSESIEAPTFRITSD